MHPKAKDQLEDIEKEKRAEIKQTLSELEENPTPDESKLIEVKNRTIYSLKIKENGLDHRAIYDILNTEIVIYTIFHRDFGYNKDRIASRF